MTRDEILALTPGRELDLLIITQIFGHDMTGFQWPKHGTGNSMVKETREQVIWQEVKPYSTDISAAWEVVENMRERFDWVGIDTVQKSKYRCLIIDRLIVDGKDLVCEYFADTAPEAICKTALSALMD